MYLTVNILNQQSKLKKNYNTQITKNDDILQIGNELISNKNIPNILNAM